MRISEVWIRAFSVGRHILQYPLILSADNEGPDPAYAYVQADLGLVVRKLHKDPVRALRITYLL